MLEHNIGGPVERCGHYFGASTGTGRRRRPRRRARAGCAPGTWHARTSAASSISSTGKKDLVISGGFNVSRKEVETALFAHPAVRDACISGVPDHKWGEVVKAVVVADGVEEAELMAWVRERKGPVLAPKSVDFVAALPLTAIGKHDKPALRAVYWSDRNRAVN